MSVCDSCQCYRPMGFDIRMAFQPIVDVVSRQVYAHEALVRGESGEGAGEVLGRLTPENLYTFDQTCRMRAIETAASLNLQERLSINFMPNAIYDPATCLARTLEVAGKLDFPRHQIIFELTEHEQLRDHEQLKDIIETYRAHGFQTAIDDFGEGFAGLNSLAEFQPDIIKLDMQLIRGIHTNPVRQSILRGILAVAEDLGISMVAEGIETLEEYRYLREQGIRLMQGFLFARPELGALPVPQWPE